jgi:hypothetical protein
MVVVRCCAIIAFVLACAGCDGDRTRMHALLEDDLHESRGRAARHLGSSSNELWDVGENGIFLKCDAQACVLAEHREGTLFELAASAQHRVR